MRVYAVCVCVCCVCMCANMRHYAPACTHAFVRVHVCVSDCQHAHAALPGNLCAHMPTWRFPANMRRLRECDRHADVARACCMRRRTCTVLVASEPASKKEEEKKSRQHSDFPGGHPPEYYPSLRLLNFAERTGYGVLSLRWPSTLALSFSFALVPYNPKQP